MTRAAIGLLFTAVILLAGRAPALAGLAQSHHHHFAFPVSQPATRPAPDPHLPTLFIVGDSTVGTRARGCLGWGDAIVDAFDPRKINVENRARGGRSARTFISEGLWDQVQNELKRGDFVMVQFGRNDSISIKDPRNRATLDGTGDETQEVMNPRTGLKESVHTYGWYLRKYVVDARARGAIPIVLSPVPRNVWKSGGHVSRATNCETQWAGEVARAAGATFIDLNGIIADDYDAAGHDVVSGQYFGRSDRTHTTPEGARFNAAHLVKGLRALGDFPLRDGLKPEVSAATAVTGDGR